MSCGVGHRHGSDPPLLWRKPATTVPNGPLAWEPPYATDAALKDKKTKKKKQKNLPVTSSVLTASKIPGESASRRDPCSSPGGKTVSYISLSIHHLQGLCGTGGAEGCRLEIL